MDNERTETDHIDLATLTQQARVVELEEMVNRLEAFIDQQLVRFENCLAGQDFSAGATADAEEILEQKLAEFAEERAQWEEERGRQTEQLKQEFEQLTAAWSRLEQEERNLLARESIAQLNTPSNTTQSGIRFVPVQEATSRSPSIAAGPGAPNSDESDSNSRSSVVRDFQQLSREMAKHARNRS